jgi:hypothetical protein
VGDDQAVPPYDHPWPLAPRTTQVDVEVQETEVSRLDGEEPAVALAGAGVVNVHAAIRLAIRRSPARGRRVRARARRTRRLFDPPQFRIFGLHLAPL